MYHRNTIYTMTTDKPKNEKSTTVRISTNIKERLQRVVREMAAKEDRAVTEMELADKVLERHLPRLEKKYGITITN